jgi:hypothetical protein
MAVRGEDLGRLSVVLGDLAGDGSGIVIEPTYETGPVIGGLETGGEASYVAGWQITFHAQGTGRSYRGKTVALAVEEAFADQNSWR